MHETHPNFLTNRIQFFSFVCGTNFKHVFSWNSFIAVLTVPFNTTTQTEFGEMRYAALLILHAIMILDNLQSQNFQLLQLYTI
jgi:hypothetical protein